MTNSDRLKSLLKATKASYQDTFYFDAPLDSELIRILHDELQALSHITQLDCQWRRPTLQDIELKKNIDRCLQRNARLIASTEILDQSLQQAGSFNELPNSEKVEFADAIADLVLSAINCDVTLEQLYEFFKSDAGDSSSDSDDSEDELNVRSGVVSAFKSFVAGTGLDQFINATDSMTEDATLKLSGLQLNDMVIRVLALMLEKGVYIQTLNLTSTGLNNQKLAQLTPGIKRNKKIQTLVLTNNWLDDSAGDSLSEIIATKTNILTIDLRGNTLGITALARLAAAVQNNPVLTALKIDGSNDKNMIAHKRQIEYRLNVNNLPAICAEVYRRINVLNETREKSLQERLIVPLNKLIIKLYMAATDQKIDMREWYKCYTNLESTAHIDAYLYRAGLLDTIVTLQKWDNPWRNFADLILNPTAQRLIAEAISIDSSVVGLNFNGSVFESDPSFALANALEENVAIDMLDFCSAEINDEMFSGFLSALAKRKSSLKGLDLSGAEFEANSDTDKSIVAVLRNNPELQYLIISDLPLSATYCFSELCADLAKNKLKLKWLDLINTSLNDSDAPAIVNILIKNQYLKEINLGENEFASFGVFQIAHAMCSNRNITMLDLGDLSSVFEDETSIKKIDALLGKNKPQQEKADKDAVTAVSGNATLLPIANGLLGGSPES